MTKSTQTTEKKCKCNGQYDFVVVGGGIMGSCTAYELRKKAPNKSVLLLEQFDFGHRRGSSHGESRIVRLSYPDAIYTDMMRKAFSLWHQAEKLADTKVITYTGGIDFVKVDGAPGKQLLHSLEKCNIEFEVLNAGKLSEKFPGFAMPEGWQCIHTLDSGICNASRACAMFQSLSRNAGAHLLDNVKVCSIKEETSDTEKSNFIIETSAGTVSASKVILTGGAWNKKLVSELGHQLDINPINTSVAYFPCDRPEYYAVPGAPVFIVYDDSLSAYGIPSIEYPGLIKFALHSGPDCDPDNRLCIPDLDSIQNQLRSLALQFLPHVNSSRHVSAEACMYTNTADEDFILDTLPSNENCIVGAGFSGHGFKFAPLVGEILAQLALGEASKFDLKRFNIARCIK